MKYYRIDERNKAIILDFKFDKELIAEIKKCSFSANWNPELKYWSIPIDAWSKDRVINLIKSFDFVHKPLESQEIKKFDYSIPENLKSKIEKVCEQRELTYKTREYQYESLYYALRAGSFINGDDVGLGKTYEAILYAEVTNSFPCIVVVPASVKYNWEEKWLEITGAKRKVSVIESLETKKRKNDWSSDVVIINYDIIGKKVGTGATVKFKELLEIPWKMFIFDEGHFLKEDSSQRSRAARMMTKKSKGIIQLLTGTAVMSRPSELWNLLVIIKKEHLIAKDWNQFILRFCAAYRSKFGWVYSGATNSIELNQKIRDYCYLRREKREVLKDLPDVQKIIFQTSITNHKDIAHAESDIIDFIRQTKGDEKAESAMEAQALVSLGVLRKLAIQGKLKAIEQYLRDWKVGGKKLVVFGLHREELDYLSKKFDSLLIAGGVSSKKKQEIVKTWINNDDVFLFANMESAGTGVDGLQTVCSNILIIELPWRPSDITQVIGRLDRSEQTEPSTITFMLSTETIDKEMWEMLESKEANTEAVNKGIDVIRQQSGMRMVMRALVQKSKNKI